MVISSSSRTEQHLAPERKRRIKEKEKTIPTNKVGKKSRGNFPDCRILPAEPSPGKIGHKAINSRTYGFLLCLIVWKCLLGLQQVLFNRINHSIFITIMSSSTIVNEVLCFVSGQSDKLNRANIESVLLDFYTQDELVFAKTLLLAECHKDGLSDVINSESKKLRKKPNVQVKVVKDLLDIWEVVDRERGGQLPSIFVAANINRLPSVNAEKFSLQFLISSVLKLQQQAEEQTNSIGFLSNNVSQIHRRLDVVTASAPSTSFFSPSSPSRRQCPATPQDSLDSSVANHALRRSVLCGNKRKSLDADVPSFIPNKLQKVSHSSSASRDDEVFAEALSDITHIKAVVTEKSVSETPVSETLVSVTPVSETPVSKTPVLVTPVFVTPATDTLVTNTQETETLVTNTPVTNTLVTNTLATNTPVTNTLVTESPVTNTPVIETLVTNSLVTVTSVTNTPVTETLVTNTLVTETPVTNTILTETPVTNTLVTEKTVTNTLVTEKTVTNTPVTGTPETETPIVPESSTAVTETLSSSSFAAKAKEGEEAWKKAKGKKKKKTPAVLGKESGGVLEGVAPFVRCHWDIAVNRLKDTVTSDLVRSHLQSKGIEVKDVWLLTSGIKGTKTAKVRVAREHKDRVKDENLWPIHCKIRDWIYAPKNERKQKDFVSAI